ncbi:hypothetical protein ACGFNV_46295 [Streptomyces sp. NPDC048751]|uniref:hypothetical protein n=1 Tax=Streptomyces sp. NPDC048751 TaxID=3365591 RepID=UPI0037169908
MTARDRQGQADLEELAGLVRVHGGDPDVAVGVLKVLALVQAEATRKKIMNTPCDGVAGQTVAG